MRRRKAVYNTDQRIDDYQKMYFSVYGKIPKAIKAGSWIHIDTEEGVKTVRSKDIPRMILKLAKKESYDDSFYYVKLNGAEYRFKKDIINLFFERLLDKSSYSILKVEEALMDYALSDKFTHGLNRMNECYNCTALEDAESRAGYRKAQIRKLKNQVSSLEDDVKSLSKVAVEREKHYTNQMKKMKKESVVFSMDDFEMKEFDENKIDYHDYIEEDDRDIDIPF